MPSDTYLYDITYTQVLQIEWICDLRYILVLSLPALVYRSVIHGKVW